MQTTVTEVMSNNKLKCNNGEIGDMEWMLTCQTCQEQDKRSP